MAVVDVRNLGWYLSILDENGNQTGVITTGSDSVEVTFTSSTVTVRGINDFSVYDEKGQRIRHEAL